MNQTSNNNEDVSLITQILVEFCHRSGETGELVIPELNEEEEAEEQEKSQIKQEIELKKLDKDFEFLKLESGSMATVSFPIDK